MKKEELIQELDLVIPYIGKENLVKVLNMWEEPHRFFHTLEHLENILSPILSGAERLSPTDKMIYVLAALYHDAIYDPRRNDNEEASVELYKSITGRPYGNSYDINDGVVKIILGTKEHNINDDPLNNIFMRMDLQSLSCDSISKLISEERKIFKEFQFHDYPLYMFGRAQVLEALSPSIKKLYPNTAIDQLVDYVKNRKIKIGIYAGSFNPFHNGHLDILKKAERIFDKVIIAFLNNPDKKDAAREKSIYDVREIILPFHQIEVFSGFLTDLVKSKQSEYCDVTLIKGLGRPGDLENEKTQLRYMEDMYPEINVAYFVSNRENEYISSSGIRSINSFPEGNKLSERYLP